MERLGPFPSPVPYQTPNVNSWIKTISSPEPAYIYGQRDRNATDSTKLNNALRMFVTSLFSSTLVPELRSFRPAPRSQLLDCEKFVFETDNKVLNILFLMPIQSWEMVKEEFDVFGDVIKVSKVFVQQKLWLKSFLFKAVLQQRSVVKRLCHLILLQ